MNRRPPTQGELDVLELIRDRYGALNTPESVTFTAEGEAIIFVTSDDGAIPLMANLTNLSAWRADGTIASDEDLWRNWLRIDPDP